MKRFCVFACAFMLGVAGACAAIDEAGNYASWTNGGGATAAFGNWTITDGDGGHFLGDAGNQGVNSDTINSANQTSFGLWNGGPMPTDAYRAILQWGNGYQFTVQMAYQWDTVGTKGFTFLQGATELGYLTIGGGNFVWNGGTTNTTPWTGLREFGDVINISLTQNGANVDYNYASTIGSYNVSGSVAGTLDTLRFFNTAGQGGSGNDLYFNKMDVAAPIPEPASMGLLGLGALALALRRKPVR